MGVRQLLSQLTQGKSNSSARKSSWESTHTHTHIYLQCFKHLPVLFAPSCVGNGIHPGPVESTSPVISSPPRRQHSISYPHHSKTRKGSRASSIAYTAFSPRPSLSRHSSIATNPPLDRTKVKDYLLLSVLACFCPVWPINIVGFVYSIMVRTRSVAVFAKACIYAEPELTDGSIFSSSPRTVSSRETWMAPCVWDVWPRCSPWCH